MLSEEAQEVHNGDGTTGMPHGLVLKPHTILGGAPGGTIDKINSTHVKVADLRSVPVLANKAPALQVSATDKLGSPEGFETTHGAPMVGSPRTPRRSTVPKARHDNVSQQGRDWSDEVFKGFEQEMRTYNARRQVNAEMRQVPPTRTFIGTRR
jgi:hypothetical protein